MAKPFLYYSWGGIEVEVNTPYTATSLPSTLINTVVVVEAPRVWRKKHNQDGTTVKNVKGDDEYIQGSQRGVWVLIERTGVSFSPLVNVPMLYKEGDEIAIHADNTYTFLNACTVEFGTKA